MENYWFWLWAGLGLVGAGIARRKPGIFIFDDQMKLTIYLVLNAFLLPIWAGPIYLIYVLTAKEKQICPNCGRVISAEETICPHCSKSLELSKLEREKTIEWQKLQHEQNPELAKGNNKYVFLSLFLFFIITPLLSIAWWFLLSKISELRFSAFNDIVYKIIPDSETWYVPAFFIGILTSYFPLTWITKFIFGNKVVEYNEFQKQMYPGTSKSFGRNLMIGFIILLATVIFILMDWYVFADSKEIAINSLFGIGQTTYSYNEIKSIRSSYQLKQSEWDRPIYVIDFINGDRWSTRWIPDENAQQANDLVIYISKQSGVQIQPVPVFSDSDIQ
jgi:hypothetical protein